MSRQVEAGSLHALTLREAVESLALMDPADDGFVQAAADVLHGLHRNPALLQDALRTELRNAAGNRTVFYSPQSFFLAAGSFANGADFTLRGNVWFPRTFDGANQSLEDYVYSYDNCHDHNFEFLTVGYTGPGYRTDLYEYDAATVHGLPGEAVQLTALGEAVLSPGTVLHFRPSVDVHLQKHPDALSISVNLLMPGPGLHHRAQYEFDAQAGTVGKAIYSSSMHYASFAFLAGELGAHDAATRVFDHLVDSPMWQLRHAAGRAQLALGLADADALDRRLDLPPGASVCRQDLY